MKAFVARQWFLIALVIVLAIGFTAWQSLSPWAERFPEKVVVALVLFLMSWSLDSQAVWRAMSRPAAASLGIAVNFIVVPLLAWSVAHWLPTSLGSGLCLTAALPCTLASAAVWTRRAGGNDAVALIVTMVTNVSCFLVTPFLLWLMTGRQVTVATGGALPAPWNMVVSLALVAVLPMTAGQLLRMPRSLAQFATANKTPFSMVCLLGILIMVLLGAINSGHELAKGGEESVLGVWVWGLLIVSVALVHTGALVLGYGAARVLRIAQPEAAAVGVAGSQKTLMIGLHLAISQGFGIGVLSLVLYHVLQLMIDTVAADVMRRRRSPLSPAADEESAALT
ncbi:MAG: bile acid:sodium symporter [Planctomycetes bacterium]|nr:bile acid:sodium symporter [Planctomycetota bacterium]